MDIHLRGAKYGQQGPQLGGELLRTLQQYGWPAATACDKPVPLAGAMRTAAAAQQRWPCCAASSLITEYISLDQNRKWAVTEKERASWPALSWQ